MAKTFKEEWKDVDGYEGLYQISSWGRVKDIKGDYILRRSFKRNEYPQARMVKGFDVKLILIHRMVAEAFIPNPDDLPIVNHINGTKCHCNIENLEWVSKSHNRKHAVKTKLKGKIHKDPKPKRSRKAVWAINEEGTAIKFDSIADAVKIFDAKPGRISVAIQNPKVSHKGCKWLTDTDYKKQLKKGGKNGRHRKNS